MQVETPASARLGLPSVVASCPGRGLNFVLLQKGHDLDAILGVLLGAF